ncbi:hypothetical protein [Schinkia azotoformans]|uniref:hypothetical protein n=1 Tax=Schinkia azotoformans TaxID=1454 RepID=UPI003D2787B2
MEMRMEQWLLVAMWLFGLIGLIFLFHVKIGVRDSWHSWCFKQSSGFAIYLPLHMVC